MARSTWHFACLLAEFTLFTPMSGNCEIEKFRFLSMLLDLNLKLRVNMEMTLNVVHVQYCEFGLCDRCALIKIVLFEL